MMGAGLSRLSGAKGGMPSRAYIQLRFRFAPQGPRCIGADCWESHGVYDLRPCLDRGGGEGNKIAASAWLVGNWEGGRRLFY